MFDWKAYKRQHVQSVDMCAAAIFAHRQKYIPIRAIYLWPSMYEQFKSWTQKNLGRDLEPEEKMQFDDVYIERGDPNQRTPLLIQLWENSPFAIS